MNGDRAGLPNPFLDSVVQNPDNPIPIDVREIHQSAFAACRQAFDRVCTGGLSGSVLFHGEAGCGKTHLLARFRRWIHGEIDGDTAPGDGRVKALFVPVRLETAPSHVWRHLRRRLAERLSAPGPDGQVRLDPLLRAFAGRHGGNDLSVAFERRHIPDLTLDLQRVLCLFAEDCQRDLCRAWLRGEPLHEADRDELRLSPLDAGDMEEESGEEAARRFVLAVTRIAAPEPVVYCFDQIEALVLGPARHSGFGPFAKMCASLVDDTANTLVISSILSNHRKDLQDGSLDSDYHRMSQVIAHLFPLNTDLGRKLIEARLNHCRELDPYRAQAGVAPLQWDDLEAVFRASPSGRCTARKLILHARDLFDQWCGRPIQPRVPIEQLLRDLLAEMRAESAVLAGTGTGDEVLSHGLPAVAALLGAPAAEGDEPGVDLRVGQPPNLVRVVICNQANMTSLARKLGQLETQFDAAARAGLRLLRDARLPVSPTAVATNRRLQALRSDGAKLVRPGAAALAALDAVRRLLSQAQSGELHHHGDPIAFRSVREWLAANLPPEVTGLMREIVPGRPAAPPDLGPILELLRQRMVMTVAEAARTCQLPVESVEANARDNPSQIGYLAGPPAVLFHVVAAPSGRIDPDA